MKADQLKQILHHYSQRLAVTDPASADKIASFGDRFAQLGPQSLKKILNAKSIAKAIESLKRADYSKDGVAYHVKWLADLLQLAGAKDSAELAELAHTIENELWGSSDALIAAVTMPKSRTSSAQPLRLDIVRSYSEELASLEHDNNGFDLLIMRIKSDRKVRKQEMHEIACRFFGYRVTPASKDKLLQKIADLQAKDARQGIRTQR